MTHLMNVVTAFSVILLVIVLISVRRSHIRVEYSVSWIGAALILLVLSRADSLLLWFSGALGVSSAPLALIMIVFCVFLGVFFRFSIVISDLKDANIAMAQRMAILEYHIQALYEQNQEASERS